MNFLSSVASSIRKVLNSCDLFFSEGSFKHGEYTFHHTLNFVENVQFPPVASELNKVHKTPLYLLVFQVVADQCTAKVLAEPPPVNNKELSTSYGYKQGCQK